MFERTKYPYSEEEACEDITKSKEKIEKGDTESCEEAARKMEEEKTIEKEAMKNIVVNISEEMGTMAEKEWKELLERKIETNGPLKGERQMCIRFDDLRYLKDIFEGESFGPALWTTMNFSEDKKKIRQEWWAQIVPIDWQTESHTWWKGFINFVNDLRKEFKIREKVLKEFHDRVVELLHSRSDKGQEQLEKFKEQYGFITGRESPFLYPPKSGDESVLEQFQREKRLDDEEEKILQDFLTDDNFLLRNKNNLRKIIRVLSNLFSRRELYSKPKKTLNTAIIFKKEIADKLFKTEETKYEILNDPRGRISQWMRPTHMLQDMPFKDRRCLISNLIQGLILIDDARENRQILIHNALEIFKTYPEFMAPIYDSRGFLIWPKKMTPEDIEERGIKIE